MKKVLVNLGYVKSYLFVQLQMLVLYVYIINLIFQNEFLQFINILLFVLGFNEYKF